MSLSNKLLDTINTAILPLKLIIPQPIIRKIPCLLSNEDLRFRAVLKYINGYLLDVGCGHNRLVRQLYKESRNRGIGVDVYPWEEVDTLVERSDQLPFEDNTFDSVTLVGVINHIPYRADTLKEINRVIKPNGILLVTIPTPVVSAIWHKWAWWDFDQNERGMGEGEVWGFTKQEMAELFSNAGFTLVKLEKFMWRMNRLYIGSPNNK